LYGRSLSSNFKLHFLRLLGSDSSDRYPIESRYSNLQTLPLSVTGDKDQIVPPASVQTLAKVFPKNQLKVMQGVRHIPMAEDPKSTAEDYLAFRATLTKAPYLKAPWGSGPIRGSLAFANVM
jgi:pimeloyl-ACP methyl ester carboxylesterase